MKNNNCQDEDLIITKRLSGIGLHHFAGVKNNKKHPKKSHN